MTDWYARAACNGDVEAVLTAVFAAACDCGDPRDPRHAEMATQWAPVFNLEAEMRGLRLTRPLPAKSLVFEKVAEVGTEPFGYDSDSAWHDFWDDVDAAIREHDPWFLLGHRPDLDEFVVDVHSGWDATLRRLNVRSVELYRRASGVFGEHGKAQP